MTCALQVACLLGSWATASIAAGQPIEDFLKLKPNWPKLVGTSFRIEGRLATGAGTTLKLSKLPLLFISQTELPELSGADLVVEVVGRLQKGEAGVLEFELLSVKKIESDLERLNRLRVDLPRYDPGPWYDLGDWATNRVRFYESGRTVDQQLTENATELYRMALRKERTAIEKPNYTSLRALALKSEGYGLAGEFKLPLLYEAHFSTWDNIRSKASSKELANVAERIAQELPDANKPSDELEKELIAEWRKGPVSYYTNAPDSLRPQLHRLLYQQVMLESIEMDAVVDGKNGGDIATRLEEFIPELKTLASLYRQKELDWRISHVNDLSRVEALALKQELTVAGDEARADSIFRQWFRNIESELRKEGADGLVELASEYETLFDDGRMAVQLLLEADRVKPGSGYVEERLEAYGYARANGLWRPKDEIGSDGVSPIDRAIRDGRVIRGMTSAQVRRSLGPPDSVSRVLTSRDVLEYWVYGPSSGSRLSVRISRPIDRHEGIVRRIFDLPSR